MKGGKKLFFLVLNPVTIVMNLDMAKFLVFLLPRLGVYYEKEKQELFWG